MEGVCLIKWNQYLEHTSLQGQVLSFHTLINLLNSCKQMSFFFLFWDTMVHILGPRNLADLMPYCVWLILQNWLVSEQKLYYGSWKSNTCFIISADKLFLIILW